MSKVSKETPHQIFLYLWFLETSRMLGGILKVQIPIENVKFSIEQWMTCYHKQQWGTIITFQCFIFTCPESPPNRPSLHLLWLPLSSTGSAHNSPWKGTSNSAYHFQAQELQCFHCKPCMEQSPWKLPVFDWAEKEWWRKAMIITCCHCYSLRSTLLNQNEPNERSITPACHRLDEGTER